MVLGCRPMRKGGQRASIRGGAWRQLRYWALPGGIVLLSCGGATDLDLERGGVFVGPCAVEPCFGGARGGDLPETSAAGRASDAAADSTGGTSGGSSASGGQPTLPQASDAGNASGGHLEAPVPTSSACTEQRYVGEDQVAIRLERLLWQSSGVETITELASGALSLRTPEDIFERARFMLTDERARAGVVAFVRSWLGLDERELNRPDMDAHNFTETTRQTIETLIFENQETGASLFSSDQAVLTEPMLSFYGGGTPGLQSIGPERVLGLLTQAEWLNRQPSPASRGQTIQWHVMCQRIPSAPPGVELSLDYPESKTRRQAYLDSVSSDPVCATCHTYIAPTGLLLEGFDELGQWRTEDHGQPIDDSGGLPPGDLVFEGPQGLREALLMPENMATATRCAGANVVAYASALAAAAPSWLLDECVLETAKELPPLHGMPFLDWLAAVAAHPLFLLD